MNEPTEEFPMSWTRALMWGSVIVATLLVVLFTAYYGVEHFIARAG